MRVLPLILALFLTAGQRASTGANEPRRDVSLVNYAFNGLPRTDVAVTARTEEWTIRNAARALHQIQVLHLPDSSSLPAVDEWIARGASLLLPPAPLAVNVPALLPGASTTKRVKLEAGVYVVLCFVPAGRDSLGSIVNHAHLGMRQTFVVRP
jgi:hypothetical protein